jgi:signal transduction histidine kinase
MRASGRAILTEVAVSVDSTSGPIADIDMPDLVAEDALRVPVQRRAAVTDGGTDGAPGSWGSRHERVVDLLIVAVVAAFGVFLRAPMVDQLAAAAFGIALALPLLWRRRHPELVFAVLAAFAFAQWLADLRTAADAALLVALYTVADRESRPKAIIATGVLGLGVVLATARWASEGSALKAFIGLSGLTAAAALLGLTMRSRRALLASLRERAARLERERDQQRGMAAAAERARIAREMHDIVAHSLTVIVALADGAGWALEESPERAAAAIATTSATGRQALSEMRRLLGVLREDEAIQARVPQPGIAQIDLLVDQVRTAGVPVSLNVEGRAPDVPDGLQLTTFRVAQEALTNTLKHAGRPVSAQIDLRFIDNRIDLDITDDGEVGARGEPGRGLRGMRERAALYGGTVDAGPRPQGGWRVHARLPLVAAPTSGSA